MAPATNDESTPPRVAIPGPIIIGAGPSGLAVAASLQRLSVPSLLIERSDSIAHLWNHQTYNRLSLHLPKHLCHLPHLPMPKTFPTYPTKSQFMSYLISYTQSFSLKPIFNSTAVSARFDPVGVVWRVVVARAGAGEVEYESRWLVVATGENAEPVVATEEQAMGGFDGKKVHSAEYRTGEEFKGERVLVVGCGNSGMELCLDLVEHGATPFMVVRSGVHVLPKEILGISTFGLAMNMLKWFPVKMVDRFLVMMAKTMLGDTEKYGLKRPKLGPLELKKTTGKTPVLDIGTLSFIKTGKIKIVPEVECLTQKGAKFVNGQEMQFDAVIFATGYRSNVPYWLKVAKNDTQDCDFFTKEGKPKSQFPNSWKGDNGLYCAGFTGKGLLGAGTDAVKIASDVARQWRALLENKRVVS
ncbi:putative indole-3-pyruvate monooxygenase YUCCA4 [Acorus gramineus]|uniref:Flavin-containing monooxygenase n=1 Tax=Acorus gramineus TaxID=55184 RepID=A0AAV9B443_ACOGR|nr:putative indole-3-pyruvate monooxygenase YUCCA4 [Acorus gramineus]